MAACSMFASRREGGHHGAVGGEHGLVEGSQARQGAGMPTLWEPPLLRGWGSDLSGSCPSHNKLWGSLGSPPISAGPKGKATAGVVGGSPAEETGCRAVFGSLRARREGPGEGKGLGKQAICMLCGQNVAGSRRPLRPGPWALPSRVLSCPVLL